MTVGEAAKSEIIECNVPQRWAIAARELLTCDE